MEEGERMKIEPGQIGLLPYCRPPLAADTYTVKVGQKLIDDVEAGQDEENLHLPGEVTQKIKVDGPRFVLTVDEIHSMFPPVNDQGNFANRLPQIVLRRRTLPWERSVDPEVSDPPPWMALLLVNEDEENGEEDADVVFYSQMTVQAATRVSTAHPEIHTADLSGLTQKDRSGSCMAVDIRVPLFHALCPKISEVSLLSHVRVVSTEDKELLGQDEDGWFSVVTCNRLPFKGATKKHRALLVSLEGQKNNMDSAGSVATNHFIRLVVLAQWQFTSKGTGDFQTTLKNIGRRGGVGLLGDSRDNCVPADEESTDRNHLVLETGHVPLNQSYRTGEKGVGLYRGPLTPAPVKYEKIICNHVDETMRVDPASGLEQIGYSAAFELGRLLGASDETLAVGLLKWRRGDYNQGFGLATMKDFSDRIQIPDFDMRMENIEFIRNPFDPLIDPIPDHGYFSRNSNVIDYGGMSQGVMEELTGKMVNEISVFSGVDESAVEAGMGRHDSLFDVDSSIAGHGNVMGYDMEAAKTMSMEREARHFNRETSQAREQIQREMNNMGHQR
jgi:hypothetical protein